MTYTRPVYTVHGPYEIEEGRRVTTVTRWTLRRDGSTVAWFVRHGDALEVARVMNDAQHEHDDLPGWPFKSAPTNDERRVIEAFAHELGMHEPDMNDRRCTYVACQAVARLHRESRRISLRELPR